MEGWTVPPAQRHGHLVLLFQASCTKETELARPSMVHPRHGTRGPRLGRRGWLSHRACREGRLQQPGVRSLRSQAGVRMGEAQVAESFLLLLHFLWEPSQQKTREARKESPGQVGGLRRGPL